MQVPVSTFGSRGWSLDRPVKALREHPRINDDAVDAVTLSINGFGARQPIFAALVRVMIRLIH